MILTPPPGSPIADLAFNGLFKLYGLAARSQELAGVLAGAGTGLMLVYGGFLIPRQQLVENGVSSSCRLTGHVVLTRSMIRTVLSQTLRLFPTSCCKSALTPLPSRLNLQAPIPFYFFTPFSWALRSLSLNEFTAPSWDVPAAGISPPQTAGQFACGVFGFYWNNSTAWMIAGPFVLLGYYLLFGVLGCSLVLYLKKPTYALGTRRTADHGAIAATLLPPLEPTTPVPGHEVAKAADSAPPAAATSLAIVPAGAPAASGAGALAIAVPRPVASKGVAGLLALPVVHATLAFRDITYTVVNPRTKKEVSRSLGSMTVS